MVFSKKKGLHFNLISDFPIFLPKSRCSLKKSLRFNLISDFPILLPKSMCSLKKKGLHLELISIFPSFRPDFIRTHKKRLQRIETVCAIFEGGPRQLPHSPHPLSTTPCISIYLLTSCTSLIFFNAISSLLSSLAMFFLFYRLSGVCNLITSQILQRQILR